MDILLSHGYFISEDAHEQKIMKPYPTLGLLYISSYLKSKDFVVEVFDSTFNNLSNFELNETKNTIIELDRKIENFKNYESFLLPVYYQELENIKKISKSIYYSGAVKSIVLN